MEDYCGLWEAVWELNTRYPDLSQRERFVAAESAVRTLISQGWVGLYGDCDFGGRDLKPLRHEEYEEALLDPTNWEPPFPRSESTWFGATDAGEEAYYRMAEYP